MSPTSGGGAKAAAVAVAAVAVIAKEKEVIGFGVVRTLKRDQRTVPAQIADATSSVVFSIVTLSSSAGCLRANRLRAQDTAAPKDNNQDS